MLQSSRSSRPASRCPRSGIYATIHGNRTLVPAATPQAVRKQVKQGRLDPIYLIVGDDEAEMSGLATELSSVVEDELRAFNLERMYAGEKAASPADIVQSART